MKQKIIKIGDENYPKNLLNIHEPPQRLYVLGNENILNNFSLAIVGTRIPTLYGIKITKSLSYGLAKQGITVVSGMAKGIDTSAHIGTLMAKGRTIAVLGSGFQNIYPKENIDLLKEIINKGGAVVTEYEEDILPLPQNFPRRNRIISGLSQGVIVTEAKEKSGSLITADLALDQGKEVFAVPRKRTIKKLQRNE